MNFYLLVVYLIYIYIYIYRTKLNYEMIKNTRREIP